jgi:hypothetical protein
VTRRGSLASAANLSAADEASAEASARRAAETMIAACDASIRVMLGVEISEEEVD